MVWRLVLQHVYPDEESLVWIHKDEVVKRKQICTDTTVRKHVTEP